MGSIELSVIIPAYNAGQTMGRDKVKYISQIQFHKK